MVRDVNKEVSVRYMEKAESFYLAAEEEFGKGRYDVAAFNACQSVILGNDALCIAYLGKRPSKDHREAIQLHIQACSGEESKRGIISVALERRSEFGDTERTATMNDAHLLLIQARRFLDWVANRI